MLYDGHFQLVGTADDFRKTDNPFVRQFVEGSSTGPIKMKLRDLD